MMTHFCYRFLVSSLVPRNIVKKNRRYNGYNETVAENSNYNGYIYQKDLFKIGSYKFGSSFSLGSLSRYHQIQGKKSGVLTFTHFHCFKPSSQSVIKARMKRFFQPIQKDGSFKKPTLSSPSEPKPEEEEHQQQQKEGTSSENGAEEEEKKRDPLKFLTWNANSFLLRVKNNWPEFTKFIENLDPDVIAIQEVRMPAAGSKGGPKVPGELKDDTSTSREEKQILMRALSSPPFRNYQVWWSLADSKYAGTALIVKKCCQPKKVSFSLDRTASKHEPDGRVILAEFESFRLLNTYVPNNGWKDEENSFQRRRKWDKRILEFVGRCSDKPLIWCGDLNVSHQENDVSHPDFFSSQKLNGYIPPNKEDCGQPGFTLNERKRFSAIISEGKLLDAYRHLHKEKDMECGFSWSGNPIGKYRGKRMRIDYFLVSEKFKDRIIACEMHGHGIELEGFYGSDHCPVSLELSETTADSKES